MNEQKEMKRGRPKGRNIVHGTNSGYTYGCRCEICKKAHADYNRPRVKAAAGKYHKQKPPTEKTILMRSVKTPPVYTFIGKRKN